jgi:sensor domain CHASE-containing protein
LLQIWVRTVEKGSDSTISIVAVEGTRLDSLKKKTVFAQVIQAVVVVVVVVVVGLQDADRGQIIGFHNILVFIVARLVTFFDDAARHLRNMARQIKLSPTHTKHWFRLSTLQFFETTEQFPWQLHGIP